MDKKININGKWVEVPKGRNMLRFLLDQHEHDRAFVSYMGITFTDLSGFLSGRAKMTNKQVKRAAKYFGVKPELICN
jgi:plasmid maintenance system antidote protein VapI